MTKIARITADKKILLSNEIIEGDKVSLNADGTLYVNEVIEGDKFSINSNGIEVTELIEDYILESDPFIDVYGFGRLVLLPDGGTDVMWTENNLSLDTELPLIYFSTLEYHVVNISNASLANNISFRHKNIIKKIQGDYNFYDGVQSIVESKNIGLDDNNKSFIYDNEYVFEALPHDTGIGGKYYTTIEETPRGKLGYYLSIRSDLIADAEFEGVITVREGSSVGDIIYRDSFRLLTERPCYLTTAMVGYFNKADDGIELTAMRELRSHSGYKYQDMLEEYSQASPIIIRGIEQSEDKDYYYNMIKDVVDNIVILVDDEEWERAETAYLDLYYYLKEKFGGV
ncbi:MAG TPA: hypothetical protein VFC79_13740, partial [Tissierellaceae bacterium]|nr:hypothetical protein [Tissierellaceae bacterium]